MAEEKIDISIREAAFKFVKECSKMNADLATEIYEIGSNDEDFTVKITIEAKRKKKNARATKSGEVKRAVLQNKSENGASGAGAKKPDKLPV